MTRAAVALILAALLVGFLVGRSSATSRPGAQSIPASEFRPVHGGQASLRSGEPDPERRTGAPHGIPSEDSTLARASDVLPAPATNPPSRVSGAKAYALRVLGPRQYACLDSIVRYESRWRLHAVNPVSGAYGWFQAYPASKLDHWGRDAMGQMRFGLAYIASRYGAACRALAHIRVHGWF